MLQSTGSDESGLTPADLPGGSAGRPLNSEAAIWQAVESGGYVVDLPFWERIVAESLTPAIDLGCGIGRVAHHLARSGVPVLGVERDAGMAAEFARHSPGSHARVLVGDVLELPGLFPATARFDRILAPQQLIQILGGALARKRLLSGTASMLSPGGVAAFALAPELPDRSVELDLPPDELSLDGWTWSSRPVSIEAAFDRIEVTRIREQRSPAGERTVGVSVVRFDRLDPPRFRIELEAAGLIPHGTVRVPHTDLHVGSLIMTARSPI